MGTTGNLLGNSNIAPALAQLFAQMQQQGKAPAQAPALVQGNNQLSPLPQQGQTPQPPQVPLTQGLQAIAPKLAALFGANVASGANAPTSNNFWQDQNTFAPGTSLDSMFGDNNG